MITRIFLLTTVSMFKCKREFLHVAVTTINNSKTKTNPLFIVTKQFKTLTMILPRMYDVMQ